MSRSRAVVATAVVGLVLALTGCNGDDPGASDDPTTSPSATSSPSDDATPTGDASASVAPATGPLLDMPNATVNAPEGWHQREDIVEFQTEANEPHRNGTVRLGALAYEGPTIPLDLQAKAALKTSLGDMKRLDDQEIAGVTFYHLAGKPIDSLHLDQFGVRDNGYETTLDFEFRSSIPPAEREKIIAEGLASFAWR